MEEVSKLPEYVKAAAYIGAAITMAIGTIGPAIGQGMVGTKACEMIGKSPENTSQIRNAMLLSMTLIETSAIYALLISLLLIFFS